MNTNLTWSAKKRNDVVAKIKSTTAKLYAKVETATQRYLDYIDGHNAYDCDLTEIEKLKNDMTRATKVMLDYCQPETHKPLSTLSKISLYLDMLEEQGLTDTDMLDDLFEHHELTLENIERYIAVQTDNMERTLACSSLPASVKKTIEEKIEINKGLLTQLAKWLASNGSSGDDDDSLVYTYECYPDEEDDNDILNIEDIPDIRDIYTIDVQNFEIPNIRVPDPDEPEKDDYYASL